jgi:NAD(P)-dependent dehydrogenase (short-subunit alcohol dehydrogenase family)
MKKLKNKIIIVTGGNGLLGKEILKNISEEGGTPICADVIINKQSHYDQIYCDISSEESIENLLNEVIKKYNKIDGLVNNAYPRTNDWHLDFEKIKLDSWKKNIDLQLNSNFVIIQKVTKYMKKNKSASIVNMSSVYGVIGPDFSIYEGTEMTMPAAYSAIKGGLISFTRYLASYYGKDSININCISPGGILDDQPMKFVKNYTKKIPLQRMGHPSDISPAVVFLLSDESSYITGQNIIIDGGLTAI